MFSYDTIFRWWIPSLVLVACVAVMVISPNIIGFEAFGILFGGGAAVFVVNYIQKVGFAGDVDRDRERETREFFQRYGMWPGQASPELIEQARSEGMLEHVVIPPRPAPRGDAER